MTKSILLIGTSLLFGSVIFSQDKNITDTVENKNLLKEVVITQKLPLQKNYISELDIKYRPIQNAQDMLRSVPGLFIGQHAGGGKAEQIFLRGFDLDHGTDIAISVDNMPVNMVSHAHGQGYADLHFLIPETVKNISFKKGSYNAEKGNLNTSGWVDFSTSNILEKSTVKLEGGMFQSYRAYAGLNIINKEKIKWYVASEYNFSNSYFATPQHFHRFNIFSKANFDLAPNKKLAVSLSHLDSKWNFTGQIPWLMVEQNLLPYNGYIDSTENGKTSRTNLQAKYTQVINDKTTWTTDAFLSHYKFNLYSNFTFFLNDPINGDQIQQYEDRILYGLKSNVSHNHSLFGKTSILNFGIQNRTDLVSNSQLNHTEYGNKFLGHKTFGDIFENNLGVYVDENINLNSKLFLNVGARYDVFSQKYKDLISNTTNQKATATFSPKASLYYTQNKNTQYYLNLGKGFHSNDARLVTQNLLNETILPSSYSSDLGIQFTPVKNLFINANLWYIFLQSELVYVGDEAIVEASGKTRRVGVDLSSRYKINKFLYADFDINFAHPRFTNVPKSDSYVPLAPLLTSTGGLVYKNDNWQASLRYRYLGKRPATEDYSLSAFSYFVADFVAGKYFYNKKLNVGVNILNLFNAKWKETQFATEYQLKNQTQPTTDICYIAGTPFFAKLFISYQF